MAKNLKNGAGQAVSLWERAQTVWRLESEAVRQVGRTVEPEAFGAAVRAIARCQGRVLTTGCGTSAAAARKVAHSLCCIERPAAFLAPGDAMHGGLGLVQRRDVVVIISKGGTTRELANLLPGLKTKRARIIAVTENPDSAIGQAADIVLRVKVKREPDEFNMLATASTLAVIAVFDAICIALMQVTGYTREQFAVIHPGGAVGQRLIRGEPAKPEPAPKHPRRSE